MGENYTICRYGIALGGDSDARRVTSQWRLRAGGRRVGAAMRVGVRAWWRACVVVWWCGGDAMRVSVVWSCAVAVLPRRGFPCIAPGRTSGPPGVMIRGASVTSERFPPFHLSLFFSLPFFSLFISKIFYIFVKINMDI